MRRQGRSSLSVGARKTKRPRRTKNDSTIPTVVAEVAPVAKVNTMSTGVDRGHRAALRYDIVAAHVERGQSEALPVWLNAVPSELFTLLA